MAGAEEIIDGANRLLFKDRDAALRMYEKAMRLEPDSERAYCGKALALMFSKRDEDAAACMRDMLSVRPGTAYAHGFMGASVEHIGKNREALACYERMLEIEPGDVAARFRRECVRGVIDSKGNQIGMLKSVLFETDDPAAIKTQQAIQSVLFRGKDVKLSGKEAAIMTPGLAQMIDILFKGEKSMFLDTLYPDKDPDQDDESADDLLHRAVRTEDTGTPAESLELVNAAIAKDPDIAEAYSIKSLYLARLGRYEEAIVSMNEFLRTRPRDIDALGTQGMLFEKVGRPSEAAACYEIMIKVRPGHMGARHLMCGLLAASGDAEGLAECYRAALEAEPDGEDHAGVQDKMRTECAELERCAMAAGSITAGFARFMEKGVRTNPMWGRGYGLGAGRARKASKRRVRAGRRR